MPRIAALPTPDFLASLLETYAVNDRMNQIIIDRLDPRAWRAKPPGHGVRTLPQSLPTCITLAANG